MADLLNPKIGSDNSIDRPAEKKKLDVNELKANMEKKVTMVLKDAVGRDELVTLAVITTSPECFYWKDPLEPADKPAREFVPKITDDGVCIIRVCLEYAKRLLASEPYKFKLTDPDILKVKMATVNGGESVVKVYGHIVKKEGGEIVKDRNGVPVMIPNPKIIEADKAA